MNSSLASSLPSMHDDDDAFPKNFAASSGKSTLKMTKKQVDSSFPLSFLDLLSILILTVC